jgi:hypothetical protein
MDFNERDIYEYLKTWGKEFVGAREICRRAGTKQRYIDDSDWALPYLGLMVERGILERDPAGRYRVKHKKEKKRDERWIAPQIAEILKQSEDELKKKGVDIGSADEQIASDEDYDQL